MSCPAGARRVFLSCPYWGSPRVVEHPRPGLAECCEVVMSSRPGGVRRMLSSCPSRARRVLLPSLYGHIILMAGRLCGSCQVKTMSETYRNYELPVGLAACC
jgi:hypothetical protein